MQPAFCSVGIASDSLQQPVCSLDGHSALSKAGRGKAMLSPRSAWEAAELLILSAWMQKDCSIFTPSFLHNQMHTACTQEIMTFGS